MSKKHPSVCVCACVCAPGTTTKTVVSGIAQRNPVNRPSPPPPPALNKGKHFLVRGAQKVGFLSENFALCRIEAHRDLSQMSRFFLLLRVTSRNPFFVVFSGRHEAGSSKNARFLKPSKNQRQKRKLHFRHICLSFLGARNPYFCSVFEASKRWGPIKLS